MCISMNTARISVLNCHVGNIKKIRRPHPNPREPNLAQRRNETVRDFVSRKQRFDKVNLIGASPAKMI